MSRVSGPVGLAIEWSPRGVVAYDASHKAMRTADDLSGLGLGGREAILALSRRGVFVRTKRVPNAGHDEVRLILMMQVGELFPIPAIDLAWDFALTDDVDSEGRLAVLAAVPCSDLRRALEAAASAGIKVKAAIPLAIGATIIAQELGLTEAAVVERADDGPAVDIVSNGSLRASRAAPPASSMDLEVTRALGLAGIEGAPIVAAGGADLENAFQKTPRTALMALAETSLDRLKLRLELPEAVAAQAAAGGRKQMRTAVLTLAAASMVAAYAYVQYSDAAAVRDLTQVQANGRLQKLRNEEKKVAAESAKLTATKAALDLAFTPPQKISEIVAVTTAAVPQGAWLKALNVERGKPISLRGAAKEVNLVSALFRKLDRASGGRFRDVQITNASNSVVDQVPVTEFVLSALPVGNLPFLARSGGRAAR